MAALSARATAARCTRPGLRCVWTKGTHDGVSKDAATWRSRVRNRGKGNSEKIGRPRDAAIRFGRARNGDRSGRVLKRIGPSTRTEATRTTGTTLARSCRDSRNECGYDSRDNSWDDSRSDSDEDGRGLKRASLATMTTTIATTIAASVSASASTTTATPASASAGGA